MATFQSNTLTIVDQTDNRKFEVYIKSNMPTVQIFNSNTGAYSPDWSSGLELTADVYLDSREMESYDKVSFKWSVDDGSSTTELIKTRTYTTANNALSSKPILTYICVASYQNITATSKITFTRVDTGKNGSDGTSVNIKGTATSVTSIPETDYYTITYEGSDISSAKLNDSYMYNGDLYTCVDSRDGVDYFINVGRIQGPKGEDAKAITLTGNAQVFKVSKTNVYTPSTISVTATPVNTTVTEWSYSVNGGQTFLSTAPTGVVRNGNVVTITGSTFASNSLVIKASDGTISDVFTSYKAFDGTDGTNGSPGASASIAFLTNENISFSANANGQIALTSFTTSVVAYSGATKVTPTLGTITGLPTGMTVSAPITTSNEQILTFSIANNSTLGSSSSNNGTITIPVTSPVSTNLILSWSKINTGSAGTSASFVDITPSALYFKSTAGSTGTFEPQYIYLYPRFQNATYSNWQYSRDGGATWIAASNANGLTIGSYNSIANSLRVDRASTLYTNDITSISFRCNSTNTSVYDTVSIAKIYDVVDLQIGGRNLLKNTNTIVSVTKDSPVISQTAFSLVDGYNVSELVGQPLTVSYFVSCLGDGVNNGGGTITGRFGMHGAIVWTRSTDGATKTTYPFSGYLETRGLNERISMQTVVTPPDDYDTITSVSIILQPFAKPSSTNNNVWKLGRPKLEIGNTVTDYSPAPEDLLNEAANVNVMLSNESHFFEATAGGIPTETSIMLDVIGYKGSIQSETTVGTISGLPSAGMTATISSNGTTSTKITVAVTSALTSNIADYGVLTIPITVNGYTINKKFNWVKAKAGDAGQPGYDAVTFQVYSNNGYALSINTPIITLQTFAYIGDVAIQADATYQWYRYNNTEWTAISGATKSYFTVSRDDVAFSNSYMCKMQFKNTEYVGVVTVDDKNDTNKVFTTKPSNYVVGDLWIVGVDYIPSGFEVGTLLRAEQTRTTYADADWVTATKYDEKINALQNSLVTYDQYFAFDSSAGLKISARDTNGTESKFSTSLTNERLSFNYGNESVAYIDGTKMNIKEAVIESPLTVTGKYSGSTMLQAPVINIGNFSIIVESNGSLSIVANT